MSRDNVDNWISHAFSSSEKSRMTRGASVGGKKEGRHEKDSEDSCFIHCRSIVTLSLFACGWVVPSFDIYKRRRK